MQVATRKLILSCFHPDRASAVLSAAEMELLVAENMLSCQVSGCERDMIEYHRPADLNDFCSFSRLRRRWLSRDHRMSRCTGMITKLQTGVPCSPQSGFRCCSSPARPPVRNGNAFFCTLHLKSNIC